MQARRVWQGRRLWAALGAVVALGIVGVPVASAAFPNLANGHVWEVVPSSADWEITFAINVHGSSQSPISVVAPNETFQFIPSSCSGSFTDPKLGGTTFYGVGPVVPGSYVGSSAFKTSYYGYSIHRNSSGNADYSDVWGLGAYWSIYCAIPRLMSPPYALDATKPNQVNWN